MLIIRSPALFSGPILSSTIARAAPKSPAYPVVCEPDKERSMKAVRRSTGHVSRSQRTLLLLAVLACTPALFAAQPPGGQAAGKLISAPGTLLARAGKSW